LVDYLDLLFKYVLKKHCGSVSEAVYKEYETLLGRFNVETGAMHKAMEKASDVRTIYY
jgi:hypothetical protein